MTIRLRRISFTCCAASRRRLLRGKPPTALHARCLDKSLILYAEHEFNASTFAARTVTGTGADMYAAIGGAIGALSGRLHGGANEVAFEIQSRYNDAAHAEHDIRRRLDNREIIIGFGHPVYTIATRSIRLPIPGTRSFVRLPSSCARTATTWCCSTLPAASSP